MIKKDIRIATWNANGILNKKDELQLFLNLQHIDICLITETHLTTQSHIIFKGYKVYKTNHPDNKARGGSAIIIKDSINHYEECHIQSDIIQLTAVGVKSMKQKFTLGAIYCPPRHKLKSKDYESFLEHLGERFILGGDFNAKHKDWGSRLNTTKGSELRKAIYRTGCNFHSSGKPTYWPTDHNKLPDLLDFFISRKIASNFIEVEECFDLDSDHSAVILTLSERIIKKEARPTLVNKTTDWEGFKLELQEAIKLNIKLKTVEQLEQETEKFTTLIQTTAFNNTREYNNVTKGINYPIEIREMVKEKRKARRKWQQTRDPRDKNILNNLTQKLRRKITKIKEESVESYLRNLTAGKDTEYSLWKATNKIKKPIINTPPIRKDGGPWARNNSQKAEVFAEHLAGIFTPNQSDENVTLDAIYNSRTETIPPVTPKEVADEIKYNMSSKKAPGFDLITGEILKQIPRKGIVMLTYLFNACFRLKHIPTCWKVAEVIMLPKPGKPPNDVKSYRPISLLPVISKLFEKLLLKRLKLIIEKHNLIPDHQFGFRSKHSTIDQIHRITDIIERALEEKQICSAVFIDVAQAFDKVWHEGLINKLNQMLPVQYVNIFSSYITDRLFRVKQEDEYSDLKEVRAGVPQGSILGPILYLLYTSDIPVLEDTTIATFADDTVLLTVDENLENATRKLQVASNKVANWTNKWRIKFNELKSAHINFTNKKIVEPISLYINGTKVPHVLNAKYLGMTLDVKLKWKEHVKKKRNELDLKFKKHYWLIGRHSKMTINNKILIYNQILKPVWLYGIQMWGCTSDSNIKIIQSFQNKVLRSIVGAPWYVRNSDIHRDLGIPMVKEEIKRYAGKHEARLHLHINAEALQLLDIHNQVRRLKRTKPLDLV